MADNIQRYVGNDLPFFATISKDGDFSLAGMTVTMSFKIGNGAVHTLDGTITDSVNGKVSFIPTVASVADKGLGNYEIKVHDGTYETTYVYEEIEFIQGVTS